MDDVKDYDKPLSQERMAEYNIKWLHRLDQLKEVCVELVQIEDLAGHECLRGANLTRERRERALGLLPSERYPVELIKSVCLRLFPHLGCGQRETGAVRGR